MEYISTRDLMIEIEALRALLDNKDANSNAEIEDLKKQLNDDARKAKAAEELE